MPQYLYRTKSLLGMTLSFHKKQNKTLFVIYFCQTAVFLC